MRAINGPARARTALLLAGILLLVLAPRLFVGQRTVDDAFITFRYARNIADGLGFVYNPGQFVLGTTTPLFAMLLSLVWRFTPDLPSAAFWIAIAADCGTVCLLYLVTLRATLIHSARPESAELREARVAGDLRCKDHGPCDD